MFDKLKNLAQDKAVHVIGGSLVASAVASATVVFARPQWQQAFVAAVSAAVAGWVVEKLQGRANAKALADGQPLPHAIERGDIIATALGSLPVVAPSLVPAVLALLK